MNLREQMRDKMNFSVEKPKKPPTATKRLKDCGIMVFVAGGFGLFMVIAGFVYMIAGRFYR